MRLKLVYILFSFILVSCFEKETSTVDLIKIETENHPDFKIKSPKVDFYDSIHIKAVLTADFAENYIKYNYTSLFNNVHLDFYENHSKNIETYIDADSAVIFNNNNNMFAYNNVYVWSKKSKTSLKTDFLEWNENKRMLFSDKYVKINSPVEIIEGYGFESNQDLSNYKIFKVSGVITK
jgi:LPS export ABC transporter protein LptC